MSPIDGVSAALLLLGAGFFLTGTVGLLRFPRCLSRLHALTKADNVGLGCIVVALALQSASPWVAAKLVLIWVVALIAATVSAHLIARYLVRAAGGAGRMPP